jgi:hypothetical protein
MIIVFVGVLDEVDDEVEIWRNVYTTQTIVMMMHLIIAISIIRQICLVMHNAVTYLQYLQITVS